jgi:CheY-like chemotaxis protein
VSARRILVVGRHPEIMLRVKGLLESAGHAPLGALTDGEAMSLIHSSAPDALLLGGGVEPASRAALAEAFREARPGRPVIEHSGGPQGLLERVREALRAAS